MFLVIDITIIIIIIIIIITTTTDYRLFVFLLYRVSYRRAEEVVADEDSFASKVSSKHWIQ